jgi:hypothetical protein
MIRKAPEIIYLQVDENGFDERDEICWCADQIEDYDVEYIRADQAAKLQFGLNELSKIRQKEEPVAWRRAPWGGERIWIYVDGEKPSEELAWEPLYTTPST